MEHHVQILVESASFDSFGTPWLNDHDPDKPFAALPVGPFRVNVLSEEEADQGIAAFCQIKDMFRQHTAMRSPIWAVVDSLEGEVAGPMTHADAEAYIKENASYFIGDLAIEPAKPELDAALSPPEPGKLSDAERAEATTPPGHQLPAAVVAEDDAADEDDLEGQYRNRLACGDSLWDYEQYPEGAPVHCPRHGATSAITDEQWLADHPAEPGFVPAGTDAR
jgi:hypothetical protein